MPCTVKDISSKFEGELDSFFLFGMTFFAHSHTPFFFSTSVAELDNDIASEQSIMYFQKLNRMPREELKVHAGALRTLQIKASK